MDTPAKRKIKTGHGNRDRVQVHFPEPTMAKQSFREECDINHIMAKFQKTGVIDSQSLRDSAFGEFPEIDFRQSMEIVRQGRESFDLLPSSIRQRFANDPAEFLDFLQDEKNGPEAIRMGLIADPDAEPADEPKTAPLAPTEPEASKAVEST